MASWWENPRVGPFSYSRTLLLNRLYRPGVCSECIDEHNLIFLCNLNWFFSFHQNRNNLEAVAWVGFKFASQTNPKQTLNRKVSRNLKIQLHQYLLVAQHWSKVWVLTFRSSLFSEISYGAMWRLIAYTLQLLQVLKWFLLENGSSRCLQEEGGF